MNVVKLFTCFYGYLHNYGMPVWVLSPIRKVLRVLANKILPKHLYCTANRSSEQKDNLIVSFTSFPSRITDVWKVVETLKRQTVLPEKIILWLSKNQFPEHSSIPDSLWKREDNLFEIRLVDGDIRSHKKYYYVMQEFPGKDFITCDDDIFYDPYMIERLLTASKLFPSCIIANNTSRIRFGDDGQVLPYITWSDNNKPYADKDRFQIGVGGVFYPKDSLHSMVLRKDLFMTLTPTADDVWLNAMARLKGTKVIQSGKAVLNMEIENGSPSLCSFNNGPKNMNDVQIVNLQKYFFENNITDVYQSKTI